MQRPFVVKDHARWTIWSLVSVLFIVAGWSFLCMPLTPDSMKKRILCVASLKDLARAAVLYCETNDQTLPASDSWMDLLEPRKGDKLRLKCPALDGSLSGFGYAMNSTLSGAVLEKIQHSESTPLFYDSSNMARNASDPVSSLPTQGRHSGKNIIAMADGHVSNWPDDARPENGLMKR